jgi:hypothetical protein
MADGIGGESTAPEDKMPGPGPFLPIPETGGR